MPSRGPRPESRNPRISPGPPSWKRSLIREYVGFESKSNPRESGYRRPARRPVVRETPLSPLMPGMGMGMEPCVCISDFAKATSPCNGPQPASSRIVFVTYPLWGSKGLSLRSLTQVCVTLLLKLSPASLLTVGEALLARPVICRHTPL